MLRSNWEETKCMTALLIDCSVTSPGQGESQGRDPTNRAHLSPAR